MQPDWTSCGVLLERALPFLGLVLGACVGSFLNVVIYRLLAGLSLHSPARSFCPRCKNQLAWYHNLPLLSWLALRGRCAFCQGKISFRYWGVEALCALLFGVLGYLLPSVGVLFLWGWTAVALAIAFIDGQHLIVFTKQTYLGLFFGLLSAFFLPSLILSPSTLLEGESSLALSWQALYMSAFSALLGFLTLFLIAQLGKLLFGKTHYQFEHPTAWSLQDADDNNPQSEVSFLLGEEKIPWSFLFGHTQRQIHLSDATLEVDKEQLKGDVSISYSQLSCAGKSFDLAQVTKVEGTCLKAHLPREVMGSGDAFILAMICSVTGWISLPFILGASSVLGIFFALFQRLGWGKHFPFGPLLVIAAFLWIFYTQVYPLHWGGLELLWPFKLVQEEGLLSSSFLPFLLP